MANFTYDGLTFHYRDAGAGTPFVFQHGLGADVDQPHGIFPPPLGIRLIAFDCRYHGQTLPNGPSRKLTFTDFARDLSALLDHLQIAHAIVGGISMGAALALKFTLNFPMRVLGLVQLRPAWLTGPNLENAARFGVVANLLCTRGQVLGKEQFLNSNTYRDLAYVSPDAADSLSGQFDKYQAFERAPRLERIPRESVINALSELATVKVPTLVLSNRNDPIHPFDVGESLAAAIPGSRFCEVTAKSVSRSMHEAEVQNHLTHFLQEQFI